MTEELSEGLRLQYRAKLAAKLAKITEKIGPLVKDGTATMPGSSFKFTSYEALNSHLRTLLPENKVQVIPSAESVVDSYLDGKEGKKFHRSVVTMKFLIIDTETGFAEERTFIGGSNDNGDKSIGKAETEAVKRFFFKLFHVSQYADRDPDETPGDDGQKGDPEPKAPRKSDEKKPDAPAPAKTETPAAKEQPQDRTYEKPAETETPAAAAMEKAEAVAKALKAAKTAAKNEIVALGLDPLKEVNAYAVAHKKAVKDMTAEDFAAVAGWIKEGGK
jgi:hypothetical protein